MKIHSLTDEKNRLPGTLCETARSLGGKVEWVEGEESRKLYGWTHRCFTCNELFEGAEDAAANFLRYVQDLADEELGVKASPVCRCGQPLGLGKFPDAITAAQNVVRNNRFATEGVDVGETIAFSIVQFVARCMTFECHSCAVKRISVGDVDTVINKASAAIKTAMVEVIS